MNTQRQKHSRTSGKRLPRIGGDRLMRIREDYRWLRPLCERCLARDPPRVRVWTELDHRIALANGGADFDVDPGQRQGLCAECHADKTAEDLGHAKRIAFGVDGEPIA